MRIIEKCYHKINTVLAYSSFLLKKNIIWTGIPDRISFRCDIECDRKSRCRFEKKLCVPDFCKFEAYDGGEISVGYHSFFNRGCIVSCREKISIGNECLFGPNCVIYDHDHLVDNGKIVSGEYISSSVIIGNRCWIGANVTILRGTIIGDNCVVGANTLLKGVIPPNTTVVSDISIRTLQKEE